MSNLSGKCDLFDAITGMGGWFDKNGDSVKFGQDGVNCYYSDFRLDFEAFYKKTGGTLHRYVKVKVDEYNQREVAKNVPGFEIFEHEETVITKSGKEKKKVKYTYKYQGKEYDSLKELNKYGVYADDIIHFETILELIPFLPRLVTMSGGNTYYVSDESFAEEEHKKMFESGYLSTGMIDIYREALAQLYADVCRDYIYYDYENRICIESIENAVKKENGEYSMKLKNKIDHNHKVEFSWTDGNGHLHWSSPKYIDENEIEISARDIEHCLVDDIKQNTVFIRYIKYPEGGFPHHIG